MIDHIKFQDAVKKLYETVRELEMMFPGRHFTPDGHMVGSIGECLVADAYGLELMTASNKGYDGTDRHGRKIEIKATQSGAVSFRSEPQFAIVIRILSDGTFEEIYNGPGIIIWEQFAGKKLPSNGQYQISINKLKMLNSKIPSNRRIDKYDN